MTKTQTFTDAFIKCLALPAKGQQRHWDANLPGFGIRVSQGGAKTWIVLHPRSKTRTQETIGRYPVLDLKTAREHARRILAERTLGKAPGSPTTWKDAVEEFLEEASVRPRTLVEYRRDLGRLKFGRMRDLCPQELNRQLKKFADRPAALAHMFGTAQTFLNWAYRKHYIDVNPMARLKAPPGSKPRERVLSDEEIRKVWKACDDDAFGRIVKLLILTGQRKSEIAGLTRLMIAGDRITIPADLVKNGRTHAIPLTAHVSSILSSVSPLKAADPILGVTVGGVRKTFSAWSKSKGALDKDSGVSDWTIHDLRRSFASGLAAQGTPVHVVEKLLNHVSGTFRGIVSVYQRYEYWDEQKAALAAWEEKLHSLVEEPALEGVGVLAQGFPESAWRLFHPARPGAPPTGR